ncbi:MAG: MgtC/SapB family protein [Candidatus Binatus sp.]|uniref:MgtC/SapB family protein n=1 Tax=Candidatus Binatus sp. TaxID=2811406 RepID=UPI002728A056|nr:MgtC/SapB family protein [Candidatus Binatus sp.]MDO8434178.1 MgtC/SapB family protein [Candidatus Binatus sp.]
MPGLEGPESPAIGFLLALAIGFLVGRSREPLEGGPQRPGIRDFLIIAMLGAVAGHLGIVAISIALFAGIVGVLLVMRAHHPERSGITTELAALATFILASLCLTQDREFGAGLGIVLAMVLAQRDQLRRLVREEISEQEYIDTLSFLGLIFIIYPLLPPGQYGPFGFFDPRKIWLFVILVSGVSYVGYFLIKFVGEERGALLTAVIGALASTTAYTTGISRSVADSPETAIAAARNALIANSILFPRMLLVVALVSPALAIAGIPAFAAMTAAGFLAAYLLGRATDRHHEEVAASEFSNPFSLWPALKFGVGFMTVLFLARAAKYYLGNSGQTIVSAISGLVDVDAISLTLAGFVQAGSTAARDAVVGLTLAAGVNAIFKSAIAQSSNQPAFYLRLIAGFVIMFAAGAAVLVFLDTSRFAELLSQFNTK